MLFNIYGDNAMWQLLGWVLVFAGLVICNEIARRSKAGGVFFFLILPLALTVYFIAIAVGAAVGLFNGFIICKTDIPPFIVTLASMNITKGIALVLTGGAPIRCMTDAFKFPGAGYVGPVPTPVILMIIIFIIACFIVNRTQLGRHIYAVGGNAQAAKFSGINVSKVKFIVYTYTGVMAGIAGIVIASRLYSGQPTAGDGAEMDAIAAVVVGGTSMSGGSGTHP